MLGTLSIAAGTGIAGWLLQHAYQHMRYSSYEREDAAMLAPGADPEQRRSWLAAIAPQISIRPSRPPRSTRLAASGDIDAGLLPARAAGAYARRYNPTARRRGPGSPHTSPPASPRRNVARGRRRGGVVARHRGERHPLPHRTDPHLAALAASCVLAFCPTPAGAAITAAGMALTWAIGAGVRRVGGEWGDGDSLMLGCVLGATAETPTVLTLVPALGAASLLFIACFRTRSESRPAPCRSRPSSRSP